MSSRESARNSPSSPTGSAMNEIRGSAVISSQALQARAMLQTSGPITLAVVSSRKTAICVKRQKSSGSSPASNQARAVGKWVWPSHINASHTLASGKLNEFVELLIRQFDFMTLRLDDGETDLLGSRVRFFHKGNTDAPEDQFTDGTPLCRGLSFELPMHQDGYIDGGANGFSFHRNSIA